MAAFKLLQAELDDCLLSPLYRSKAMYIEDQPDFTNAVVTGLTDRTPEALLDHTQAIEAQLGRDRSREQPKGPRTMDIDILLFGDRCQSIARLEIPHPGMLERAFVLQPLVDLAPDLVDPVQHRKYKMLLAELAGQRLEKIQVGETTAAGKVLWKR